MESPTRKNQRDETGRLSPSIEDYLKAIYKLETVDFVATTEIARSVEVSSASVTNMLKRLARLGLVEYQSYKGVRLTGEGRLAALETIRHHRLLETYLRKVMGYTWDQMHEEAEHLEHHISEDFEEKLDELLGFPTHDPHGHPIPSRELSIQEPETVPLTEAPIQETLTVHHLSDTDADVLHYLEELGLMPRNKVQVKKRAPFDGPLTITVDEKEHVLGHKVAGHVFVLPD